MAQAQEKLAGAGAVIIVRWALYIKAWMFVEAVVKMKGKLLKGHTGQKMAWQSQAAGG